MLGKYDECYGQFGDKELIRELEIMNLLKIVTSTETKDAVPREYLERLNKVLSYYAKDKIDNMEKIVEVHKRETEEENNRKIR